MTNPRRPVLIAGAGPTGLVLALVLARRGVPLRIVDPKPGPGEGSRAMAVQARTLELYRQLGIADGVVAEGLRIGRIELREGGAPIAQLDLGELGEGLSRYPFALAYAQDDHERFLIARLREAGVEVEWLTALSGLAQHDDGVQVLLDRGGHVEEVAASYVCGCDGAHSRVRQALGLGFPGGTYEQLFYVADVQLAGESDPGTELRANLGEGGLGLGLPVRRTGSRRLIGNVPEGTPGDPQQPRFEDLQPRLEALLGVRVDRLHWFSTYRVHHRVAEAFRVGRVFIAGDAGHIHSPAGGQGMNTGIGDAFNLGWKLAWVWRGEAAPALLDSYEAERLGFARRLVRTTDQAFQGIVSRRFSGRFLRTRLLPLLAPAASRLPMVRRGLFGTVSQIRLHYRDCPLSEGQAGRVRGGDRLPWLAGGADDAGAGDNFAPLRSLCWRLQVYGAVAPALADAAQALGLPLDRFDFSPAAEAAGFARDAAYLLRPDGHVAWAGEGGAPQTVAALQAYFGRWRLSAGCAAV